MTNVLIEKLEEHRSRYHNEVVIAEDIIDDCIDIVKEHSGWIPQDNPPPNKSRVLAFDGRREFICLYDKGYYILANGEYYGCVTHWQNLPSPPHEPKGGAYERDLHQIQKQPPSEVQP